MTDTALVLHYAQAEPVPANSRGARVDVPAEWVLASAVFAAFLVALMVAVGAFAGAAAGGEWVTWAGLWFVALVALLGGVHLMARLRHGAAHLAATWRARRAVVRTETAMRIAARGDPRMRRELQVLGDRAEWRTADR
jgi:hypothetical protein